MTDAVQQAAEEQVAALVGTIYSGAPSGAPGVSEPAAIATSEDVETFSAADFDADFQTALATHCVRNVDFMRKVGHLVNPNYFENAGQAAVVNIALRFWRQYGQLPSQVAAKQMFKEDVAKKVIRGDITRPAAEAFKQLISEHNPDIGNTDFFAEQLATFARHQAVGQAIMNSVDWLNRKQFDKIESAIKAAAAVGVNTDGEEYSYWDKIGERTQRRKDKLAGILPPTGVTTGIHELDQLLYHKGWGRRELTALMGGPKTGKTTALIGFGKAASLAGYNALYVTLEVSKDIIAEREDATVTDTLMKELGAKPNEVEAKVKALSAKAGALQIHEYPSGTFTPAMLKALIERYKSPAILADGSTRPPITFDMVLVDYADIMQPNHRSDEARENSKSIWLDLRAIADIENVAMLTATATNRDGIKATVADMTHVADDINKVRTVDLMISINITDEERAAGEARLHFTASRNQESGFTVFIKQDIARMKFIAKLLKVE